MRRALQSVRLQRACRLLLSVALFAAAATEARAAARVAVVPFRVHSAKSIGYLGDSLANLIRSRLEASAGLHSLTTTPIDPGFDAERLAGMGEDELRALAGDLGADFLVSGSVTELAGRYSLDVRVTPAAAGVPGKSLVFVAEQEDELLARVDDVAAGVLGEVGTAEGPQVASVVIEGAGDLEPELAPQLATRGGAVYDPATLRDDLALLRSQPQVAAATVQTERGDAGVAVRFKLVLAEALLADSDEAGAAQGAQVGEVRVRGNRRIEAAAILARVSTKPGHPFREAQLARDLREINALGFFRSVDVFVEDAADGTVVTFQVEENPVVRQISISGNDHVDGDKIRDILTLTTGSTLDLPALFENRERIATLYRAEGYYLAEVDYEIETLSEHSVGIHFLVDENQKLKLRSIAFDGNEQFTDAELKEGFRTKIWRFYSYATSWLDRSGTYSEPLFLQDLQTVQQKYADAGYLQVDVAEPDVIPSPEGIEVIVRIREGRRFSVGKLDVIGDESADTDALKEKLLLKEGEILNRSYLTDSVALLTEHYQDRGFFYAEVQPQTRVTDDSDLVDVAFHVRKGQLYFVREIDVSGNTNTVDPVLRREVQVVEGELYSQRKLRLSQLRLENLGFFEEVDLAMEPTEQPEQLDLEVRVVEKPTGSFSFGAGYSSQDGFVLTGALSQANLFGRGYSATASVDYGGSTQRFYLSLIDPYFLGSDFSFGTTIYKTTLNYEDFEQDQYGIDLILGHALSEDRRTAGRVRYSYASREISDDSDLRAAGLIFREFLTGAIDTSLVGISLNSDTRDSTLAASSGRNLGLSVEAAGPLGFARFLRAEARALWYLGAPWWMPEGSSFVVGTRIGGAYSLNSIGDYSLPGVGVDVANGNDGTALGLEEIDDDLTLPLAERYFLGGLGEFQLRGFRSRSVGPRRPILWEPGVANAAFGSPPNSNLLAPGVYIPVGKALFIVDKDSAVASDPDALPTNADFVASNDPDALLISRCADVDGVLEGDGDGTCNDYDSLDDLDETDVVGGNKFISSTLEYRFPISEMLGLQGVVFFDTGNAYEEGEMMFDPFDWRYGTGIGVQWFSPFGPLAVVLGYPLDKTSVEDAPVFEFSVGGRDF